MTLEAQVKGGGRGRELKVNGREILNIKILANLHGLTLQAIADRLPISEAKSIFEPGTKTETTVSNWANNRNTEHIVRLIKFAMLYDLSAQVLKNLQDYRGLKTLRVSKKYDGKSLTQRQVADFLSVSENAVANWEKDRTPMVKRLNVLGHLCTVLKVEPSGAIPFLVENQS